MTGHRRLAAPRLALVLTALLLAGGCGSGSSDEASSAPTTTTAATTPEQPTTTTTAPASAPEPSSSTTTSVPATAALARRPNPTTSSSAPAPATRKAPATTTTTEWHVPAENLVPGSPPQWSTWTPPSTVQAVVVNPWTPAPGVEMSPPYQAPAVGPVEYVGCTRQNANNLWMVQVRATLTGGRYWRFPSSASGNTGIFSSIHQSIVGDEFDPDGFDGTLTYVTVETGAGAREDVPVSPHLRFHCAP